MNVKSLGWNLWFVLLLGIVFSVSSDIVLSLYAITLRDIRYENGSLLKFYSVILCDTLITIVAVGRRLYRLSEAKARI